MWFLKLSVALVGVHQVSASIKASAKDALIQGSASRTLAGFQKYTDNLVNAYLEKGETIRADSPDCNIIREYIEGLHSQSLLAHEQDQGVGAECTTQMNSCDTYFTGHNSQLDDLQDGVSRARTKHSTCRNVQAGACEHSDSLNGFAVVNNDAANKCELYNYFRKNTEQADLPDCAGGGDVFDPDHFALGDVLITADEGTTAGLAALHKMEACLVKMKNWLITGEGYSDRTPEWSYPGPPGLFPRMDECATNTGCCSDPGECMDPPQGPGECCDKQHQLENKHCSYEVERQTHCTSLRDCWAEKTTLCNTQCGAVEERVVGRKLDNETMERISCLLDALTDTDDTEKAEKLEACKADGTSTRARAFQTSLTDKIAFWDIDGCPPDYVAHPNHSHCQTPILGTCHPDWLQQEYGTWKGLNCGCEETCKALYDNEHGYTG